MDRCLRSSTVRSQAILIVILAFLVSVTLPTLAFSAIRYVADNGTDTPGCGLTVKTACRSITQAMALAVAGDTVIVGPGRYGDLNENGVHGEPGEEAGGTGCLVDVNKPLIVLSSGGAAATRIDARGVSVGRAVCISSNDVEFGRPAKGFTIRGGGLSAVFVPATISNVAVKGHMLIGDTFVMGIQVTATAGPTLIEGNYVTNFNTGINSGSGNTTINANHVTNSTRGIFANGATVTGNIVSECQQGIALAGTAIARRNAVLQNDLDVTDVVETGFVTFNTFTGVIEENNIIGNGTAMNCGLQNGTGAGLSATKNYWGAPSGPGAPPADAVCGFATTTSPFVKKPYVVKILKP